MSSWQSSTKTYKVTTNWAAELNSYSLCDSGALPLILFAICHGLTAYFKDYLKDWKIHIPSICSKSLCGITNPVWNAVTEVLWQPYPMPSIRAPASTVLQLPPLTYRCGLKPGGQLRILVTLHLGAVQHVLVLKGAAIYLLKSAQLCCTCWLLKARRTRHVLGCGDAKPFLPQSCLQPLHQFTLQFIAEADEWACAAQT